jgi:hypothetical protein
MKKYCLNREIEYEKYKNPERIIGFRAVGYHDL